jgi:hypothetical protein
MTLAAKIRDNKAVYTGAGAVDLAVEKLREVPETVAKIRGDLDKNVAKYRGTATENVAKARSEVTETVAKVRGTVNARVIEAREAATKLQQEAEVGKATAYVSTITTKVNEIIDELAERGKGVVNRAADEVIEEAVEAKSVEAPAPKPVAAAAPAKPKATTAKKPAPKKTV